MGNEKAKNDNLGMDFILKELCDIPYYLPESHLEYALIRNRDYRKADFKRLISHLVEKGFVKLSGISNEVGEFVEGIPNRHYSITVEGKSFYLKGGFNPSLNKKITRWLISDVGYGNLKWIITSVVAVFALVISLLAYLK